MRVVFDLEAFRESFPTLNLSMQTPASLQMLWDIAISYVGDDDGNSFAPYQPEHGIIERRTLLYLVMAHQLRLQEYAASTGGLSGRVTAAAEGSVSVSVEPFKADSMNAQYWSQTPEGQHYWMLTAKYRLGGRIYCDKEPHPFG